MQAILKAQKLKNSPTKELKRNALESIHHIRRRRATTLDSGRMGSLEGSKPCGLYNDGFRAGRILYVHRGAVGDARSAATAYDG